MQTRLASLGFAALLAATAFGFTASSAQADCRGPGPNYAAGPYYGGSPTTYGYVGVGDGSGNYVELNGGQTSSPGAQLEGGAMGYGGYINTDGDYDQC